MYVFYQICRSATFIKIIRKSSLVQNVLPIFILECLNQVRSCMSELIYPIWTKDRSKTTGKTRLLRKQGLCFYQQILKQDKPKVKRHLYCNTMPRTPIYIFVLLAFKLMNTSWLGNGSSEHENFLIFHTTISCWIIDTTA